MVEHALRADAASMERDIIVHRAAMSDAESITPLMEGLERQQSDILEEAGQDNDYSAIKKLKSLGSFRQENT